MFHPFVTEGSSNLLEGTFNFWVFSNISTIEIVNKFNDTTRWNCHKIDTTS